MYKDGVCRRDSYTGSDPTPPQQIQPRSRSDPARRATLGGRQRERGVRMSGVMDFVLRSHVRRLIVNLVRVVPSS